MNTIPLYEQLEVIKPVLLEEQYKVPSYITENLKFDLYEWQRKALENFFVSEFSRKLKINKKEELTPTHLMFNMATGSGKTLVMAALILYYYKQGYRNFLFFVNQNAILGKTQDNFIKKEHPKYLFKDNIIIDGKRVTIKEVDMFSTLSDSIQIKFTSIHKLHNDIYKENENSIILSDLQKLDIVMLGDEAHHLNAITNKTYKDQKEFEDVSFLGELKDSASDKDIEKSWETTVNYYLLNKENKFKSNNKNVLLEFTATIPDNESTFYKYNDKMVIKFDLKEFVLAGCTKNIRLLRSSAEKKERILQALLLNWYRTRIALKYDIPNFKPVILFRSKSIDESKKDYDEFIELCKNITEEDFIFLNEVITNTKASSDLFNQDNREIFSVIKKYIDDNKIPISRIANYIKDNFGDRNCLITNSKTNKKKKEQTDQNQDMLLNSLENISNPIRAVFTVARLTEGWDVLNLYDIVRLYHGRDKDYENNKVGKSTTSEIQLIGRGVRYNPFKFGNKPINRRKFDSDLRHEARILEEFYFHSDDDSQYISDLSIALKEQGLIPETRTEKTFSIKKDLQDSLDNVYLWVNTKKENPNRRLKQLPKDFEKLYFDYAIVNLYSEVRELRIDDKEDLMVASDSEQSHVIRITLKDIPKHIVYKAIHMLNVNSNSYFSFENLRKRFDINSIEEFIEYLNAANIQITCPLSIKCAEDIDYSKLLKLTIKFLRFCNYNLEQYDHPYCGEEFKLVPFRNCFPVSKTKMINIKESNKDDNDNTILEQELKTLNWYALDAFWGTSEERELVKFIKDRIGNLEQKYDVLLLRNEEVYTIFDFDSGNGFQPDFLLLLRKKNTDTACYFQVFIEPKGKHLLEKDSWKEQFLNQIMKKYGLENPIIEQNDKYMLFGLPFFNNTDINKKLEFEEEFNRLIL